MISNRQRLSFRCAALFLLASFAAAAQQSGSDNQKEEIAIPGHNGVSFPQCQDCPAPQYSPEAQKKKHEGVVVLMIVVTAKGKVGNIRVTKSTGFGLDEKAIEAVRKWIFKPATKDGKPVPVQVPIEVTFRAAK